MVAELERSVVWLAEAARRGEAVEAYAEERTQTEVVAYEGEVERMTSASTRGVGVRVLRDHRLGYAFTTELSEDGLRSCLEEARTNLAFSSADEGNVLAEAQPFEPVEGLFSVEHAEASVERKVALALQLERETRHADPRVRVVEAASYGDALVHAAIASSLGIAGSYGATAAWCSAVALAGEGEGTQVGSSVRAGRGIDELHTQVVAMEAAQRASRMVGASKPLSATVPVVLDEHTAPSLIGVVLAALSAEAVQKRRSVFAGALGEQVAAAGVRLIDDGRLAAGLGSVPFDGEGVPTGRLVLIEDGLLRGYLHNVATAARAGTRSTGSGVRGSFKATPGVGAHNAYLEPGDVDEAGLIARAGDGLLVQEVSGVHSGTNPTTGDFSVGASGLWIRGGELAEPVRDITVAGRLTDLLAGIVAVGRDLRFTGSVARQAVLIGEMTVAGA